MILKKRLEENGAPGDTSTVPTSTFVGRLKERRSSWNRGWLFFAATTRFMCHNYSWLDASFGLGWTVPSTTRLPRATLEETMSTSDLARHDWRGSSTFLKMLFNGLGKRDLPLTIHDKIHLLKRHERSDTALRIRATSRLLQSRSYLPFPPARIIPLLLFSLWARVFCDYKQRARTHFNFVCKTKKCGGNQFVWSMSVRYCSTRGTWWVTCVDWFRDLQRHVVMPAPWTTLRRPLLKMWPLKLRFNDFYVTINIYQRGWRGDI